MNPEQENAELKQQLLQQHDILTVKDLLLTQQQNILTEQQQRITEQQHRIDLLEELIRSFRQRQFGSSSEKTTVNQLGLFNEAEEAAAACAEQEEAVTVAAHTRSRKPRISIPADLPREEIVYDLDDEHKVCPRDGARLQVIGSEDHEQLEIIPAQIRVIRHKRLKYACPCCEQHLVTASKPKQPIEKSIASPGLLAFIATQKYCDALPLYRQSEIFKRLGIALDRSNLANWMVRCGELIQPLLNLLQDQLMARPLVHMDETTVQVLTEPGKTPQSHSTMWLMASFAEQPVILFHYAPSRSRSIPQQLLCADVQALMVDGYEGYQQACADYQIRRLGCWAHARRKFVEAQKLQPKGKTGKADQALAYIQTLYAIEKTLKEQPPDQRYSIRQQQAKPVIDKLQQWLQRSLPLVPPKTALGKALYYLHHQWDRLIGYLEQGTYPIDNNLAENAIRPFTVGRKNWLFAHSQAGAKASANLYSLIQTAKANGLNPYDYLKHVFKELPNAQNVEAIEKLLPWHLP